MFVCPGSRSHGLREKSLKHDSETPEARSRLRTEGTCIGVSLFVSLCHTRAEHIVDICRQNNGKGR